MGRPKKVKVEEVVEVVEVPQEEFVNNSNITVNSDRWDGTVNTNESPKLPSLDD